MAFRTRSESPLGSLDGSKHDYCPIVDAGAARRRAEQDAILLANRIRLLKAEDAKTRKKIKETEQKTHEILLTKKQREEQKVSKEMEEARRLLEYQELRSKQLRERDEHQRRMNAQQQSVLEKKALQSHEVRQQKVAIEEMVRQQQSESMEVARLKHEHVKRAVMAGAQQRTKSEDAKHEMVRNIHVERLRREDDERRLKEEQIERMEKEEVELLEKLKRSQERHRLAFRQLEDALSSHQNSSTAGAALTSSIGLSTGSSTSTLGRKNSSTSTAEAETVTPSSRGPLSTPTSHSSSGGSVASSRFAGAPVPPPSGHPLPAAARPPRPHPGVHANAPARVQPSSSRSSPAKRLVPDKGIKPLQGALEKATLASSTVAGRGDASGNRGKDDLMEAAGSIMYTTVDGAQLEIPVEEDLDLEALFRE
mmetsp:Transcript_2160/g.5479  ORF Transcript_2160/g.5479 Transcript_2160/m.5479 type:complete len:423 (+) Transcript_2160:26-1294(+)